MNENIACAGECILEAPHVEDLKLAAAKMWGAPRRAFKAEMVLKYCAFGSSAKTSDFIVDGRHDWWNRLPPTSRTSPVSRSRPTMGRKAMANAPGSFRGCYELWKGVWESSERQMQGATTRQ